MTLPGAVVLGATGGVGRPLTRYLLTHGFTVLAQGRKPERLDQLRESAGADAARLATVACGLEHDDDVAALAAAVAAQPVRPSAAVAALGGWYVGADLVDVPATLWNQTIAGNLTSHYIAARAVAPALGGPGRPSYLLLNGVASLVPCVGSGAISVAGAGQTMLVGMLRAEAIGTRVRFRQLTILGDILLTPGEPSPTQVAIEQVARTVAELLTTPDGPDDARIRAVAHADIR